MRLLDKLKQKMEFHLAQAVRFGELITVLEEDDDVKKMVHQGKLSVVNGAKAQFDAVNSTAPKRGRRKPMSPAEKRKQGLRMKKLWKTKRAMMLKATARGRKKVLATRRANKLAPVQASSAP